MLTKFLPVRRLQQSWVSVERCSQRLQERFQLPQFYAAQAQGLCFIMAQHRNGRLVVVFEHFTQGRHAATVHVGCRERDIAQSGGLVGANEIITVPCKAQLRALRRTRIAELTETIEGVLPGSANAVIASHGG